MKGVVWLLLMTEAPHQRLLLMTEAPHKWLLLMIEAPLGCQHLLRRLAPTEV